jgi:flagella basal body P-ring formation protein FlgA
MRLKPVLSRGQLADAIIRDGAMIISLKVEVLEEGVPGQVVRVRNPQSRRELRGKVLDEQTIAIAL